MAGLPRKTKAFMIFIEGYGYGGEAKNFTPPKVAYKTDDYQGGTMPGSVAIHLGLEPLEGSFTCGGTEVDLLKHMSKEKVDALQVRFAQATQRDDDANVDGVEYVLRGRFKEIDLGTIESGALGETKLTIPCSYYKCSKNGVTLIEIDIVNGIEYVNGEDRFAKVLNALGINSLNHN